MNKVPMMFYSRFMHISGCKYTSYNTHQLANLSILALLLCLSKLSSRVQLGGSHSAQEMFKMCCNFASAPRCSILCTAETPALLAGPAVLLILLPGAPFPSVLS
jgi:hypothetical protein